MKIPMHIGMLIGLKFTSKYKNISLPVYFPYIYKSMLLNVAEPRSSVCTRGDIFMCII